MEINNFINEESFECEKCNNPDPTINYCPVCGRYTGRIKHEWLDSRKQVIVINKFPLSITAGTVIYLRILLEKGNQTKVKIDTSLLKSLCLQNKSQMIVKKEIPAEYKFIANNENVASNENIIIYIENGKRNNDEWWCHKPWDKEIINIKEKIRIKENRWMIGNPVVLFPPGVRSQHFYVWNNADFMRIFDAECPDNYILEYYGSNIRNNPICVNIESHKQARLTLRNNGRVINDSMIIWEINEASPEKLKIVNMVKEKEDFGPDLIIAIDYGTCNVGIRVRWRNGFPKYHKKKDQIDEIGERRFSSSMILHKDEINFYWGNDAQEKIDENKAKDPSGKFIAVENLKTDLHKGIDNYIKYNPMWTNEKLVYRFFEKLFILIDEYIAGLSKNEKVSRNSFKIKYVITRPVLDEHEGKIKCEKYENIIKSSIIKLDVNDEDITFLSEPAAAAQWINKEYLSELDSYDEGDLVAVFDSGGGTTDIVLARIRRNESGIQLEVINTGRLFKESNELGGNDLDERLVEILEDEPLSIIETGSDRDTREFTRKLSENNNDFWEMFGVADDVRTIRARSIKEYFIKKQNILLKEIFFVEVSENLSILHSKYYQSVIFPMLSESIKQMAAAVNKNGAFLHQIKKAFFVGGTNIDEFVRKCYYDTEIIPNNTEFDFNTNNDKQIEIRLNAVVNGAVWSHEKTYKKSPVTLSVKICDERKIIIKEGKLLSANNTTIESIPISVEPYDDLSISLYADCERLSEEVEVARGWHQNETDSTINFTFSVNLSANEGCKAELTSSHGDKIDIWHFKLFETK